MRVKLPGKLLLSLVKAGCAVAKPADERQILRNLFLVATDKGLEITATDTTVAIWFNIPTSETVVVEKTGRAVVNAQNLLRTVEAITADDVTLVATERSFQVISKGSKFKLCVEDASDFPKIARFSARKPFITVKTDLVLKMVKRTAFCAHNEPSFQLMHGLLLRVVPTELRMVATNGQRLSVTTLAVRPEPETTPSEVVSSPVTAPSDAPADAPPEEEAQPTEVVIPAETALLLKRIVLPERTDLAEALKKAIRADTETIDLQWGAAFFNARTNLGEISVRALSGCYPMYGRGVPNDLKKLKIDRQDLIDVLKQATAIKSATHTFVALHFKKDRIVFSAIAEGAGDTEIEYEFPWDDEDCAITVSPDFMLETLEAFRGEYVLFEVGDAMTPTVLREVSAADEPASFCVYAVVRQ